MRILFSLLLTLVFTVCQAQTGFLRDGDVWVFLGDSITDAGPYRATVEKVCRFYHPNAKLTFVNRGVPGSLATASAEQFAKAKAEDRPTIVSVMTGMNNSINSYWREGLPMEPALKSYRESILTITKSLKANGLTVILLSPTLTDERLGWSSMWELSGTAKFLQQCGNIVKDIAEQEKVIYLPAAEEFEEYQQSLLSEQVLRHDGVHPHAAGQYRIAATFLRHLAIDGPLDGSRTVINPGKKPCPVKIGVTERFAGVKAKELQILLTTDTPGPATVTWEYRGEKKSVTTELTGKNSISLPLSAELPQEPGQSDSILIEIKRGDTASLYLLDVSTTRVLHAVDGKVSGFIDAAADRPEGKRVGNWSLRINGKALVIDAEIFDTDICNNFSWAWGRDGVNFWLDLRPPGRFADVGIDNDISMSIISVQDKPIFGATTFWWLGRGLSNAAAQNAEKTATGYKVSMSIEGKLSKFNSFDAGKVDYIGFTPIFVDMDNNGKSLNIYTPYTMQRAYDHYGNGLMIFDIKNKFPDDKITNLAISAL